MAHNVRIVRQASGVEVMAVVKANAYGYGAAPVAQAAVRAGASWLGVVRVDEALALREAAFEQPILMLGMVPLAGIDACIAHEIHLPVGSFEAVNAFSKRAAALGKCLNLHLKVDTGMGRLGVLPEEALALAQQVVAHPRLYLAGVFSHLANADRQDDPHTILQMRRFQDALAALHAGGIDPGWVHLANTAAALRLPLQGCNLVRCGQALVGHNAFADARLHPGIRPAMLGWKARLEGCWVRRDGVFGQVSAGFGDGYWRQMGNEVLLGGTRCPVVGLPGFDWMQVRLDRPYPPGTEVALAGTQGSETITIHDLARRWGTGPGKITAVIPAHVPRHFVGMPG